MIDNELYKVTFTYKLCAHGRMIQIHSRRWRYQHVVKTKCLIINISVTDFAKSTRCSMGITLPKYTLKRVPHSYLHSNVSPYQSVWVAEHHNPNCPRPLTTPRCTTMKKCSRFVVCYLSTRRIFEQSWRSASDTTDVEKAILCPLWNGAGTPTILLLIPRSSVSVVNISYECHIHTESICFCYSCC